MKKISLLNVYCPCDKQTADALHEYRCMLGKLKAIIYQQNFTFLLIIGDFNVDPTKGRFWNEMNEFVQSLSLAVLNERFPVYTFTYLCPARNITSWLDHVVCSKQVIEKISNLRVDYSGAIYDHFPICFDLSFEVNITNFSKELFYEEFVDWRKVIEKDKVNIRKKLDDYVQESGIMNKEVFHCIRPNCQNPIHLRELELVFPLIKGFLLASTEEFTFEKMNNFRIIPGWNMYVREYYAQARKAFLTWKEYGKPQDGLYLDKMKETRDKFKKAFNECKRNEDKIRKENMLSNLENKNYKAFWNETNKLKKNYNHQLDIIDNISDTVLIANLFSNKYKSLFDTHGHSKSEAETFPVHVNEEYCSVTKFLFSRCDVHSAVQLLKPGLGFDKIHSNHIY